jgi:hypothetical protein
MSAGSGIKLDAVSHSSPRSPKEQEVDLGNQMRSIMVKAKIELQRKDDGWQVKDTTIDYDGQEVQRLGSILHVMEYEEAVKEAKRWTMVMVLEKNRKETEDDIVWELEPSLPTKHILKL